MSTVQISASDVNKLRQATGAGLMDCKKALTESGGDFDAAIDYLRKKGQKVAAKRADREANEGVIIAKTTEDGKHGVIILLSAETDFVAKNEDFIKVAESIADAAVSNLPGTTEDLLKLEIDGTAISSIVDEQVAKIGEKIEVKSYELVESECVVPYIHAGYRIGVLVALNQPKNDAIENIAKDVAMQIAAMNPLAVDQDGVDEDVVKKELEIGMEQARAEGKPEAMLEKIATGKLNKFFKENTLINQAFVKDGSKTIDAVLKEAHPDLKVKSFKRLQLGQ